MNCCSGAMAVNSLLFTVLADQCREEKLRT